MQMIPADFWHRFTFADFQVKAYYFFKNKEAEFKDKWQQVRVLAHRSALCAGVKADPEDIVPLPWDNEVTTPKEKPLTASEGASIVDRYRKLGFFDKPKLN